MARDGMHFHVVYIEGGTGVNYLFFGDGGITWDPAFLIGAGGQPFIAYTGCVFHVIWINSRAVYYRRHPTGNGNCLPSGISIPGFSSSPETISVFPKPAINQLRIQTEGLRTLSIVLYDVMGKRILCST